jgi:hypothetical protein
MKETVLVVGDADNTANTGDEVLQELLDLDLEFNLTIIVDDEDNSNVAGNSYGLVIISSSVNANQLADEYLLDRKPVLVMDDQSLEQMNMVEDGDGDVDNDQEIEMVDDNHPIAKVLGNVSEEEVEVYNNNADLTFGEPAADADIIASNVNDNDEATIFMYEAGAELAEDDDTDATRAAPNRRGAVFVTEEALNDDVLTADGQALLEAAILYTWNGTGAP